MVEAGLRPNWPELVKLSCLFSLYYLPPFIFPILPIKEFPRYFNETVHMKKACKALSKCEGFPGGSVVKNLPDNAGDADSVPESGRSPGEGNDNPLQYSSTGNPMDRGACWATVHGVAELDMA